MLDTVDVNRVAAAADHVGSGLLLQDVLALHLVGSTDPAISGNGPCSCVEIRQV